MNGTPKVDQRSERCGGTGRAQLLAGCGALLVMLLAFVIQLARGQSGWPYSMLGFLGGVSYVAAVVYLRVRG